MKQKLSNRLPIWYERKAAKFAASEGYFGADIYQSDCIWHERKAAKLAGSEDFFRAHTYQSDCLLWEKAHCSRIKQGSSVDSTCLLLASLA